jgi:hypothetical protein
MTAVLIGAQVLVLAGMVAVSAWGSKHIDPEKRIRVRAGATGIDWTIGKKTALLMVPIIGLIALLATIAADPPSRETVGALGLAVMLTFLWAHWYSVKRAVR